MFTSINCLLQPSPKGQTMSRTSVRRVVFKLAVLIAMTGALFFYRSDTRAQYGTPGCDNNYQYCVSVCLDDPNTTWDECAFGGCATDYFGCWQNENPPVAQPQLPCPACVAECDFQNQVCVAEGVLTPFQCVSISVKCKQRCNYGCYL